MRELDNYLDDLLAKGQAYFSKEAALIALGTSGEAFSVSALRRQKKQRLISPRRGFYLILRPEDRISGAPDPARWIDPFMNYLELDYRISLLRAAAFHGSSHQAAMVFQVIIPKQIPSIELGRHKIQFIYQTPKLFAQANQSDLLDQMKTDAGFAKVAGVELTLLNSIRYFHKAAGINSVAQIIHDLGNKAEPKKLARAAGAFENSSVRRLGYLLDYLDCKSQARALLPFVRSAKSVKMLALGRKTFIADDALSIQNELESKWKILSNQAVEIDS